MAMRNLLFLTLAAAGLVGASAFGQATPAAPSRQDSLNQNLAASSLDTATIVNTGSTNTTGYSIVVSSTGKVKYQVVGRVSAPEVLQSSQVSSSLTRKLYKDLSAAMPLAQLPVMRQMKSASFGTSTYITYKGQRAPDLSAPADARGQALKDDITAIAAALNLKNGPRRPGPSLTPFVPGH